MTFIIYPEYSELLGPGVSYAYNEYDFVLNKDIVKFNFLNSDSDTVEFTFKEDDVALEYTELISLLLIPADDSGVMNLLSGEGVFFRKKCVIEIVDDNGMCASKI